MNEDDVESLIGPEWMRVARARNALADAVADIDAAAAGVADFSTMGTDELGPAVAALVASDALHDHEAGARWVSSAYRATPEDLLAVKDMNVMAFGGAMMMLRLALHELDEALAAAGDPEDS